MIPVIRSLVVDSLNMLLLRGFTYSGFELQTPMPMHMPDMWVWLLLLAAILIAVVFLTVYLSTRPSQRVPPTAPSPPPRIAENPRTITIAEEAEKPLTKTAQLRKAVELVRPTLTDDERRVLNEVVKAGGEILQSDLPEKTDFSKATVSKLIKSLETMGVVTREKHKWTYWVTISDKLIYRTKNT